MKQPHFPDTKIDYINWSYDDAQHVILTTGPQRSICPSAQQSPDCKPGTWQLACTYNSCNIPQSHGCHLWPSLPASHKQSSWGSQQGRPQIALINCFHTHSFLHTKPICCGCLRSLAHPAAATPTPAVLMLCQPFTYLLPLCNSQFYLPIDLLVSPRPCDFLLPSP